MEASIQVSSDRMPYHEDNSSVAAAAASTSDLQPVLSTDLTPLLHSKFLWGASLLLFFFIARAFTSKQKLPAGVKRLPRLPGLPYIGRPWDVPGPGVAAAWHFGGLHKKYGPIYEWYIMGTLHIWVETDKVARDLFVTRQKKYCDRNDLPATVKVKTGGQLLPLMGYGDQFKRYKNFMHYIMRNSSPKAFYGWPVVENKKTLRRLLETPDRWSEHMIVHCARTIGSVAWGDPQHGSKLLQMVPYLLKSVSPAGPIINKLSFLANLPEAISPWKQQEKVHYARVRKAFWEALTDVKERHDKGLVADCWSSLWFQAQDQEKEKAGFKMDWDEAAHAIGSSSFVAIATIGGPLHAFFAAMCHYPAWQVKVQAEIDHVCPDRLPTTEDMPKLPMLRATVKEVLRWRQPTPLGVPHVAMEDDIYEGYLIPKGAIVHANHYLISREESMFPRGEEFLPERWIDPSYPTYKEPLTEFPNLRGDTGFGYGNRACPGVDLTQTELTTLLGALLWSFNIARHSGRRGDENPIPWYEVNPFVITMMKPFDCSIQVRSEAKRAYILEQPEAQDAGYLIRSHDEPTTSEWDMVRPESEALPKPYTWEGLTVPFGKPATMPTYAPGI
nr:hypothetical protein B0A51_16079 [Rachicladosporium sp. CCFEE 5018]